MYCPNCGSKATTGTRFCRTCGKDLQIITQAMNGELHPLATEHAPVPSCWRRQRMLRLGLLTFLAGALLAPLLATLGRAILPLGPVLGVLLERLAPLGGLATTFGIGMMVYSRFLPKTSHSGTIAGSAASHPRTTTGRRTAPRQTQSRLQEQPRSTFGSVTEATTRLFEEEAPAVRATAHHT